MTDHPSYNVNACCGDHCYRHGDDEREPCWGPVAVVDEVEVGDGEGGTDWVWMHACQGHLDTWDNPAGAYKPPPDDGAP